MSRTTQTVQLTERFEEEIVESYITSDIFIKDYSDECMCKDDFIIKGETLSLEDIPISFVLEWVENYKQCGGK